LTTVNIDQYNQYMKTDDWLSAAEALGALGIKRQSLYAYVSRGLLRAMPDPSDPRKSLYSAHDVKALEARKRRPRGRADVAAGAIAWGDPVLESGISTVRDGQLYFGAKRAIDLAESASLEQVAARHWNVPVSVEAQPPIAIPDKASAKARGYACLAETASDAPATLGRTSEALARADAFALLSSFADAMIGARYHGAIHMRLAQHWRLDAQQADRIRRALVLLSDHELNPSTFAVRVAAATGTSLAGAALAGYAALNGPKHGDASTSALHFLREALTANDLSQLVSRYAAQGTYTMGFGHNLYAGGDPRAANLLEAIDMLERLSEILAETTSLTGHAPNIDAALSALAITLNLPDDAPFCLFAIARMAGWLGHAIEQVTSSQLIRPRATFVARAEVS
jgi:citrate synthase